MRPALQRLLSRPSSSEFLRILVGPQPRKTATRKIKRCSSSLALKEDQLEVPQYAEPEGSYETIRRYLSMAPSTSFVSLKESNGPVNQPIFATGTGKQASLLEIAPPRLLLRKQAYGDAEWSKKTWSTNELDLESNLKDEDPTRLLNREEHMLDQDLWLLLLEYRQREYGFRGVRMFWRAIVQRGIRIPTSGPVADKMWRWFIKAGSKDANLLEEIFRYAEEVLATYGRRWTKLSLNILERCLVKGTHMEAMAWHNRLVENHPLGNRHFLDLCYRITSQNGNLVALKEIYQQSDYQHVYPKVVPHLCAREDFKAALEWHFLLLERKDLPPTQAIVEPLLKYLATYHPRNAAQLVESLHAAGASFASDLPLEYAKITPKNSKEFVSTVHSKTFHVSEKKYNDNLGARWLATSWITLDTAIKGIHALGVQEIGPLSLHSIALREPDAGCVLSRVNQLKDLGISIGTSQFSLAVYHFARNQQQEFLSGLVQSDQHPHELDDIQLQERLLGQYARNMDWKQFRRTLEILSFRCSVPEIEKRNLMMRISLKGSSISNIKENLVDMQHDRIPIKTGTIFTILESVLGHRQLGHNPMTSEGTKRPLDESIDLLRQIIHGGSHVPIKFWREIIRRLGMLGHFHALEDLCLKITTWYGPGTTQARWSRTPAQVSTRNPNHPFRILFEDSLQKAIVEWGFIHALDGRNLDRYHSLSITSGIRLLKKLSERGVYINRHSVRSAVLNRLCIYYGQGQSNKPRNRAARDRIHMSLEEMAAQIDDETGITNFAGANIERIVEASSQRRLGMRAHKGRTDAQGIMRGGKSPSLQSGS